MKKNKKVLEKTEVRATEELKKRIVCKNGSNVLSLDIRMPRNFESLGTSKSISDFYTAIADELTEGAKRCVKTFPSDTPPTFVTADYSASTDGKRLYIERRLRVKRQSKLLSQKLFPDVFDREKNVFKK